MDNQKGLTDCVGRLRNPDSAVRLAAIVDLESLARENSAALFFIEEARLDPHPDVQRAARESCERVRSKDSEGERSEDEL